MLAFEYVGKRPVHPQGTYNSGTIRIKLSPACPITASMAVDNICIFIKMLLIDTY